MAGLVAGMAFCMAELFGLVLTGAGINPAKSFGTAFVKAVFGDVKALSQVWVFLWHRLRVAACGTLQPLFYGKPRKKISRKETDEKEALELLEKEETTE